MKLQVLLNPPTQYFDFALPSQLAYAYLEQPVSRAKLALWHMGMANVSVEHESALLANHHSALLLDRVNRVRYHSYLDTDLIAQQYKKGRYYYTTYGKYSKTSLAIDKNQHRTVKSYSLLIQRVFIWISFNG